MFITAKNQQEPQFWILSILQRTNQLLLVAEISRFVNFRFLSIKNPYSQCFLMFSLYKLLIIEKKTPYGSRFSLDLHEFLFYEGEPYQKIKFEIISFTLKRSRVNKTKNKIFSWGATFLSSLQGRSSKDFARAQNLP